MLQYTRYTPESTVDNINDSNPENGFTLIELMIVIAIIAIILTLALPLYTDYTVRAKLTEAIEVSKAAKSAVSSACQESRELTTIDNALAGYAFSPSKYVQSIVISGACEAPVITMQTTGTGAATDPIVTLTGNFSVGDGRIDWVCASTSLGQFLPAECRS